MKCIICNTEVNQKDFDEHAIACLRKNNPFNVMLSLLRWAGQFSENRESTYKPIQFPKVRRKQR